MKFTAKKSAIAAFVATQLFSYSNIALAQDSEEESADQPALKIRLMPSRKMPLLGRQTSIYEV